MHASRSRCKGAIRLWSLRGVVLLIGAVLLVCVVTQQFGQFQEIRRERRILQATSELQIAVARNDVHNVKRAIEAGAMLNVSDSGLSFTPLHHAVLKKNKQIIQALVAGGANLDALSRKGTPLCVAVESGDSDLVRHLLDLGSDPNRSRPHPIEAAIKRGQLPMLDLLLARGARLDFVQPTMSGSINGQRDATWCLFLALNSPAEREVKLALLRFLLSKGAGPPSGVMHIAVADSDAELGALLRGFGAPYTAREAVAFGHMTDVKSMVEGDGTLLVQSFQDFERGGGTVNANESTLLAMALKRGYRELANVLIDLGAPLQVLVESNETLVHMATSSGDRVLVGRMLELGLDVDRPDRVGRTPLHYAAAKDYVDVAELLIGAGADVNKVDRSKNTPLHTALMRKSMGTVRLLISAGANVDARNTDGKTPSDLIDQVGTNKGPEAP